MTNHIVDANKMVPCSLGAAMTDHEPNDLSHLSDAEFNFRSPSAGEEVIRLDKEGFHYRSQFIEDAGEAHRLMVEFLRQSTAPALAEQPVTPMDEEIDDWHQDCIQHCNTENSSYHWVLDTLDVDIKAVVRAVLARWGAPAALAQPEPEGPTDEEIMELMPQQMRDDLAAAARALAGFDCANIKAAGVMRIILNRHAVDHARAVLAKWGRFAITPIPAAERWPEFSDCDPQERVWAWNPVLDHWKLSRINRSVHTHWLPANALPVPADD